MKQLVVILLFISCIFESRAMDTLSGDSLYHFRFVRNKGMFYVPYKENSEELSRLLVLIRQHQQDILSGNVPVFVEGFASNRQTARERSNRVKTEMILRGGLREECFQTTNHAEKGDYVAVRLDFPAAPATVPSDSVASPVVSAVSSDLKSDDEYDEQSAVASSDLKSDERDEDCQSFQSGNAFLLRTNLLRIATLTADLGIEYRFADARLGVLLNGTYTDWGWKDKQRRYKVWRLSPEVRYYLGNHRRGFLGAMYHRGEFHYKFGETGKTGDYQGGGITGGYRLPLNRHFGFDFHAAAGYTRARYDKYTRIDGFNVRQNKDGKLVKNYWGINQLGVSLLYKF